MKILLRIDSSIRTTGSYSRHAADYFQQQWRQKYPGGKVLTIDLAKENIPHIHTELIEAFYAPNPADYSKILTLSDRLISDLQRCDILLISCPVYNFTIPSTLKAYIDHIVRVNRTFRYGDNGGYRGLLQSKQVFIIVSRGDKQDCRREFHENYLRGIFNFIGMYDITFFSIDGTADEIYARQLLPEIKLAINNQLN